MDIFKIGVIGAGKMGAIIAVSSLTAGFETVLLDLSDNILESARNTIKQQLERLVEKNIIEKGKLESLLGKLKTDTDYKALEQADLIIETVPEVLDIKRKTLAAIEDSCRSDAIIASNTSTFSISELAAEAKKPERVAGMHFFLPPSKLVEISRGSKTSDNTVLFLKEAAVKMGKRPVVIKKESPGFIANRVYTPLLLEAFRLYEDGVASPEDIDNAMKDTYLPVGPFELADIIGLDVLYDSLEYYRDKLGPRWDPPKLLKELVKEGRLGKKTGKGIYEY